RRALRRAAQLVAGDLQGLAGAHIREAMALLGPAGHTGGAVAWPEGLRVRRERDRAFVEPAAQIDTDRRWPRLAPGEIRPVRVPRHLRDSLVLLAQDSGAILWIPGPGGRRSILAPVTAETRRVLVFEFSRNP